MTPSDITRARERYRLTQRALANLLGTSESTVSRLERGTAVLDTRWASHLKLLFGNLQRENSYV